MVQLMPLYPETPSSIASFTSRLVLPFWYWLTQVVLEKRPLTGCGSSSSSNQRYGDGVGNAIEESCTIFFVIQMH